jgi:hypothetical protein
MQDEKSEYRLNQYGSKERPAGENVWVLYAEDMSQEEIDIRAVQAAEEQAKRDAEEAIETARITSLYGWDNKYILLCRSLGLPDISTTEEIQVKLTSMKNEALATNNLAGALQSIELGLNFLAIINAITQMGGKFIGIKWHETDSNGQVII